MRRSLRDGRWLAAVVVVAFVAGCATGPSAPAKPSRPAARIVRPTPPPPPHAEPAADWESFSRTGAALGKEIERRAEELKSGPIAKRGQELASLRLAASGRDLIDSGSLEGAEVALQKAISLDGSNGYAYLFLAYVHHVNGRESLAAEFASSARRYLPRDAGVRAELEGLALSIRAGSATVGQ